jgi:aminobenzoyl-glutamate utilization protein B
MKKIWIAAFFTSLLGPPALAQKNKVVKNTDSENAKSFVTNQLDHGAAEYYDISRKIWSFAELGFLESKSAALLIEKLRTAGFIIKEGLADMPTAFTAAFGKGKPVIGILAEYDALPGLSQDSVPVRKPLKEGGSGHGCGHNLFGTASVAAAISLKEWLVKSGHSGTVRLYGTPAEEGGGGKVFMARAGLFNDLDVVLHWHPSDANKANAESSLAIKTGNFRFYGISAHAAAAPQQGRSALDGVESMDYMVNLMREHVPQETRIHYVIKKGGLAANVVPDYAEVEYMVRHPDANEVRKIWDRVVAASEGAAKGTGTRVEHEVITGLYNLLPNETLSKVMHANLTRVGGIKYAPADEAFARQIQAGFGYTAPPLSKAAAIEPYSVSSFPASTDVGDVSWMVPTVGLGVATWVPGTSAHSWQAVAANGMAIGQKAMLVAAKTIAMTAIDLYFGSDIIQQARLEWETKKGSVPYQSLLGDRKPPLDFRKGME